MKVKILIVLIISLVFYSCKTSYKVYDLNNLNEKFNNEGFYYFLPNNVLKVSFEVEKEEFIKGPYAEYAKHYFGLDDVVLYNTTNYSICNINVDVFSEPDSSHCYLIVPNKSNIALKLDKSGVIESLNCANIDNKAREENHYNYSNFSQINENIGLSFYSKIIDLNVIEKIDTIVKKIKIDTNFIIEKTYKSSIIEKPIEQKVKDIAENISKIREAKYNLITGEIEAIDKKNLEFMYTELQNMEDVYLKLFTGLKNKTSYIYTFYCYPTKDTLTNIYSYKLFSFSNTKGLLDKNAIEGDWIFLELVDKGYNYIVDKYSKKFTFNSGKGMGIYYRIPALVDISVKQGNKKIYFTQKYLSQLGVVSRFPNQNLSIYFDKITGRPLYVKNLYKK